MTPKLQLFLTILGNVLGVTIASAVVGTNGLQAVGVGVAAAAVNVFLRSVLK